MFAMRRESAPFLRTFRPHRSFAGAPCWARFCSSSGSNVLVTETGIGQANVARALDWLLAKPKFDGVEYRPRSIVFAGFAGALRENLHIGDVVSAGEVIDARGESTRTTWLPATSARLLTMDRMIASPEEKRRLGAQYGADIVDMESAVFAARCAQAGIPFGCVRAISDEMATPLSPKLVSLLSGGRVSPWRLVTALARRPSMVRELLRLGRDTRRAAEQLGQSLIQSLGFSPGRD